MTTQYNWDYTDTKAVVEAYQLFTGETPQEGQMAGLINFIDGQQAYFASQGLDPTLGGYEAIGLGLATSLESDSDFAFRHAQAGASGSGASDLLFAAGMYRDIYSEGIPDAVLTHYMGQLNYFEALYAGVYPDPVLMAHAAVAGQMLGYAQLSGNYVSDYNTLGDTFWADATNGDGSQVPFDQNGFSAYGIEHIV